MTAREKALALFQRKRKEQLGQEQNGYVQCPYCRRWMKWEDSVAVHFYSRRFRSLEVEPFNVYAGCAVCNGQDQLESGAGQMHELFREWILENYGEWRLQWLDNRKNVIVKHGTRFYENLIKELRNEGIKGQENKTDAD